VTGVQTCALPISYYRQSDYSKALEILDKTNSRASPVPPDYHYLRGKVELALHQDQAGGEELLKAVAQQPDNESLCSDTGLLFFHADNFWKALQVYESCARNLPDSVPIETGLGLTYFRLGKYDEAANTFRKILAVRADADAAREALAFLLYVSGAVAEARTLLEQRLRAPDADYYTYYLQALVLLRLEAGGAHTDALQLLDEAVRRNSKFAPAYFQRGKIRAEHGDAQGALADLREATRLDSAYAQPYYLIAQIEYKLGRKKEAEEARLRFSALDREKEEKDQKRQVENRLLQSLQ